jgi:transcriptional pleiotropic regulator of transition state genes
MAKDGIGVVRNMDPLGRVVIPMETRMKLNIADRDMLEFFVDGDSIVLKPYRKKCVFCGEEENLNEYKEKLVCNKCRTNVSKARPVYY